VRVASADFFTTASQLSILIAGRAPQWSPQPESGSGIPPSGALAGIDLDDAVRTLVHVALRADPSARTAALTVVTPDLTATYTVKIGSHVATYDAGSAGAGSAADIIDGIAAAMAAVAGMADVVGATPVSLTPPAGHDTVIVRGEAPGDYGIEFTATGTAVVACIADPVSVRCRFWGKMGFRFGSTPPVQWVADPELLDLDFSGLMRRVESGGIARLFVQIFARKGHHADGANVILRTPIAYIGPCLSETEGI
jgi:hypothetical protein